MNQSLSSFNVESDRNLLQELTGLETSQIKIENFRRSQASILPFDSAPQKLRNLETNAAFCGKRSEAAQNESTLESLGRNIFYFSTETSSRLAQN